ncbi:MAG: UbiH/UbiF/VisC/COQ6 family ubiquinone biosynthesis hydroxylase [Halioglobus sp.]
MSENPRFDVTIIGAGIAGSALAGVLSGHGLSIALVEGQPLAAAETAIESESERTVSGFDARVSALTPNSQALLSSIGAWDGIAAQRVCPYRHMTVWDADGTGIIEFDCADVSVPELGHIVENRVIVNALLGRVRNAKDITVFNPARLAMCSVLESGGCQVELEDGRRFLTGLLVAADGALSKVRTLLEFETREWDYGHRAIVATVQLEHSHQATAWQRFLPTGPLAFLPLPQVGGLHYCSIVWSLEEGLVDDLLALDEADFCAQLEVAIESRLGKIRACSQRFAFPLRQRHAVDYVRTGVALLGDAAHTIHPLAGQGINLGLQDVSVLAQEILGACAQGIDPGELAVLKRYQRRRKGENLAMMVAMDGFKALFAQRALPIRWLRNAGMRGVDRVSPVKQQLMRHAMGIGR